MGKIEYFQKREVVLLTEHLGWEERCIEQSLRSRGLTVTVIFSNMLSSPHSIIGRDRIFINRIQSLKSRLRWGALLDSCGLKTINSYDQIYRTTNKFVFYFEQELKKVIKVPRTKCLENTRNIKAMVECFGFPLVIKGSLGRFGRNTFLCESMEQCKKAIEKVMQSGEKSVLVQEYIPAKNDHRILIVGETPVASIARIQNSDGEWRTNTALGAKFESQPIDERIESISRSIVSEYGPGLYGVDVFNLDKDPVVCEINSAPNFKNPASMEGVNISDSIFQLVEAM